MIRIVTFTTLFPNAAQPGFGVFVRNRLEHLLRSGDVDAKVVAPVAVYPLLQRVIPRLNVAAAVPSQELSDGIEVHHPRYPLVPKISMSAAPFSLYAASLSCLRELVDRGFDFDLIDAHYFYPDGVAATLLGRALGKPVVITGRGTDLTLIPRHPFARWMIRWAAERAAGLITVSQSLKERLMRLGVAAHRIKVLRNGVDLDRFRPVCHERARARFGFTDVTLLSVGNLVDLKGHDLVIRALHDLPFATLVIVGDGPDEARLRQLSRSEGLEARVRFLGRLPHTALPELYGAADALVLASSREGWPNVLLEAMACGTPVVATRVGGVPEIVSAVSGELVSDRTPSAIAEAVKRLLDRRLARDATRRYAERFSWDETTSGQVELFRSVMAGR